MLLGLSGGVVQAQKPDIWTGLYLGAHAGYGTTKWSGADIDIDTRASGGVGGLHVGYNYQSGSMVMGLEIDHSFASLKKKFTDGTDTLTLTTGGMTSVRGRLGFTLMPSLLVYGTVGYGWVGGKVNGTDGVDTFSMKETAKGAVFGGGAEYRFTPKMSVRGEVLHYASRWRSDDGDGTLKVPVTTIRAGLSLHF